MVRVREFIWGSFKTDTRGDVFVTDGEGDESVHVIDAHRQPQEVVRYVAGSHHRRTIPGTPSRAGL